MNNWKITEINPKEIANVQSFFGNKFEDLENSKDFKNILSSIFLRRNIKEGQDILYFLENDLRFLHSPYNFSSIEDAVERILQAKDEEEKVLIFGDSDVDGITSTAILYLYLKSINIDVEYKLPKEEDGYGLSISAIDEFYNNNGSLIITVDCGISNNEEINHANDLGIDVIVTDHHNPPEDLPYATVIVNPKTDDSNYPFKDISGAAVSYKLVEALRFAHTEYYNSEVCILHINENQDGTFDLDCLKTRNLLVTKQLHEKIDPQRTSIYDLRFPTFVQGNLIYVWDSKETLSILNSLFGYGIDFNLTDLKSQISQVYPSLRQKNAFDLPALSVLAKYIPEENSIIKSIFNLFVSYSKRIIDTKYPLFAKNQEKDLQLVALAALADIMPMKNENRILVNNGLNFIKKEPCNGLRELFSALRLNFQTINSIDLSWTVIPALNATGRLGQPEIALELLIEENPQRREQLAFKIVELNEKRKEIVNSTIFKVSNKASESLQQNENKLCLVIDESIHQGLTGLFAGRLMSDFKVPSIAICQQEEVCTGSMRSNRGVVATDFLNKFGDFFINHGGHDCAAGFSFETKKLPEFLSKIKNLLPEITLEDEKTEYVIDANIPPSYLNPELFKLIDLFEPYGNENPELILKTEGFGIYEATEVGKKEPTHLKLTFANNNYKFPAMYWSQGELLRNYINVSERCDILYSLNKNYFNGTVTNQFIIKDLQK